MSLLVAAGTLAVLAAVLWRLGEKACGALETIGNRLDDIAAELELRNRLYLDAEGLAGDPVDPLPSDGNVIRAAHLFRPAVEVDEAAVTRAEQAHPNHLPSRE
jgi:hypothetical protein